MDSKTKKRTPKQQRKAVLSVLLVVAILITTAFAFLSATDSKTNVFTVGSVSIKLIEKFDTDLSGTIAEPGEVYDASNDTISLVEGKSIVPGQKVIKQPYITNNGKNSAYVYMVVGIPTDISDNVYNGRGTYTSKSELAIKVNAYAIQEQYNGATNADETWTNYFKNSMISGTASDAGIELFTLNDGKSTVTTGKHTIGSDWQEFSTPYSVNDGGNTYRYHFFKYTANNGLLSVNSTTQNLFEYVVFNENIGGPKPPEPVTMTYLIPEENTNTLASEINLATTNDIPEGWNVYKSETYMPGNLINQPPYDNSLTKTGTSFSWVDKESNNQILEGQIITQSTYAIPRYKTISEVNEETETTYLTYEIGYDLQDGFSAILRGANSSDINYPNQATDVIVPANVFLTKNNETITLSNGTFLKFVWGTKNTSVYPDDIPSYMEEGKQYKVPVVEVNLRRNNDNAYSLALKNIAKSLVAPESVKRLYFENSSILENAFVPCSTSFQTETDGTTVSNAFSFLGCSSLKNVTLSDSLISISFAAFQDCGNIASIDIPTSVKSIRSQAFAGCNNLVKVNYSSLADYLSIDFSDGNFSNPLKNNGSSEAKKVNLYINNEPLPKVLAIPAEIVKIPAYAFSGCTEIDSIVLHDNITEIGERAFDDVLNVCCNESLKALVENSMGCLSINKYVSGDFAFEDEAQTSISAIRAGITTINIPSTVTSLSRHAFTKHNNSSTIINIPTSVSYVEDFLLITSPATINYAGTIAQLEQLLESSNSFWAFGGTTVHCADGDSIRPEYC